MGLLEILVTLAIACLIIWGAREIMKAFGIGDPIHTIVIVVLVFIIVLRILGRLGYGSALNL